MIERRHFVRVPVNLTAAYNVMEPKVLPPMPIKSADVSLGGIRLCQTKDLSPGKKVAIALNLPLEGTVMLYGIVIWCRELVTGWRGYYAGIQLTQIAPAAQARLNAFFTDHFQTQNSLASLMLDGPQFLAWRRAVGIGLLALAVMTGLVYIGLDRDRLAQEANDIRQVAARVVSTLSGSIIRLTS